MEDTQLTMLRIRDQASHRWGKRIEIIITRLTISPDPASINNIDNYSQHGATYGLSRV
ncbi:hypothetical protein BN1221_02140c [Brenneria goodwinii]|uniref:Uncharacterized protein n=1 Tax=Brenneria goodwinii TaxID=1109412 RepID=A0A0G4JVH4_9GAMM|nr:hypothetical protein BN1221_02140c [Brenneria goodwinii]